MIKLIVGLGNPGAEYDDTRHNAGFWFVDELARQAGESFKTDSKFFGQACKISLAGETVWLLKPSTFMNRSGQSISALAKFYKIKIDEILVAHDELDMVPGVARLKRDGGHGGHNGLRDTIKAMGGKNFLRLRLGIDHPGDRNQVSNYVLAKPSKMDRQHIDNAIDEACRVMPEVVKDQLDAAMNVLHTRASV